jgi:hypothetical protein
MWQREGQQIPIRKRKGGEWGGGEGERREGEREREKKEEETNIDSQDRREGGRGGRINEGRC